VTGFADRGDHERSKSSLKKKNGAAKIKGMRLQDGLEMSTALDCVSSQATVLEDRKDRLVGHNGTEVLNVLKPDRWLSTFNDRPMMTL